LRPPSSNRAWSSEQWIEYKDPMILSLSKDTHPLFASFIEEAVKQSRLV
jgi:hypothetical protein